MEVEQHRSFTASTANLLHIPHRSFAGTSSILSELAYRQRRYTQVRTAGLTWRSEWRERPHLMRCPP